MRVVVDASSVVRHAAGMSSPKAFRDGVRTIARKVLDGVSIEATSAAAWKIDAAGNCENPVGFSHVYRTNSSVLERATGPAHSDRSLFLDGEGRCRRCDPCRRARRSLWARRAKVELAGASRTWWGTLTQGPAARSLQLLEAKAIAYRSGVDFDALPAGEQYERLCRVLGGRFARYVKRLRKTGRAKVRYLLVAEPHQNGDPHLHVLLHEVTGALPKRLLEAQWQDGFSSWRLVESTSDSHAKVAWYITKYMLKAEEMPRLRASFRYGLTTSVEASALPGNAPDGSVTPQGVEQSDDPQPLNSCGSGDRPASGAVGLP